MVVRKKMFRDCSRFRTVCLFVNCSAVLVKTVFKSSFCFSYVLFVAAVAMYHVNNVFRVLNVNQMTFRVETERLVKVFCSSASFVLTSDFRMLLLHD